MIIGKALQVVAWAALGLFIVVIPASCIFAAEELTVKKDNTKTVYIVGSTADDEEEKDADKEKAWDMLENLNILIDRRGDHGEGQNHSR